MDSPSKKDQVKKIVRTRILRVFLSKQIGKKNPMPRRVDDHDRSRRGAVYKCIKVIMTRWCKKATTFFHTQGQYSGKLEQWQLVITGQPKRLWENTGMIKKKSSDKDEAKCNRKTDRRRIRITRQRARLGMRGRGFQGRGLRGNSTTIQQGERRRRAGRPTNGRGSVQANTEGKGGSLLKRGKPDETTFKLFRAEERQASRG